MDDDYVEAVLSVVEAVGAGSVTTYGAIAAAVARGGPRQVGRVMRLHGDGVAWWRVVHADGSPRPATAARRLTSSEQKASGPTPTAASA
jgi:alkylated DNA nucleotide flippase Atl1